MNQIHEKNIGMRRILFILVILFQIGVLGFMIAQQELILHKGAKVLLKCKPVDPRSLFSGDYVILSYEISAIDQKFFDATDTRFRSRNPNEIFVALKKNPGNDFWSVAFASKDFKKLKARYSVVIRGTSETWDNSRVKYGVENYFVPQNQGLQIEKNLSDVSVEVAVSEKGESAISKLFIDGKEVRFY
jgi:uncharacterized membrane-anchored protein